MIYLLLELTVSRCRTLHLQVNLSSQERRTLLWNDQFSPLEPEINIYRHMCIRLSTCNSSFSKPLVSVKTRFKLVRSFHTTGGWKSTWDTHLVHFNPSNPPFHRRIWMFCSRHCSRYLNCINWNIFKVWDNLNSRHNVAEEGSWKAVGQTGEDPTVRFSSRTWPWLCKGMYVLVSEMNTSWNTFLKRIYTFRLLVC